MLTLFLIEIMMSMTAASALNRLTRTARISVFRNGNMAMSSETLKLVLVRHGESTWNQENKFTGWYDCPLSDKGHHEAEAAGKLLKEENFKFDAAYTSMQQRAIRTLWYSLEQTGFMYIPIKNAWQLNERYNRVSFLR